MKDIFDLKGHTALITGSSQGIGSAIAMGMAAFGATVIIHYHRDRGKAENILHEIQDDGGKAFMVQGDLSLEETPEHIYSEIQKEGLKVDILVLNASIQERKKWNEIDSAAFDRQMAVNLKSTLRLIQLFTPLMEQQKWGRIVTIGSVQQSKPHPDMLVYSASKAGMVNLVMSLAKQLAPKGITVNNLAPGVFETIRNEKVLSDPAYRQKVLEKIPSGKFGDLEDCAGIAVTLCSRAGKYITGQDIYVDGGMNLI